jgi:hypothetical protein
MKYSKLELLGKEKFTKNIKYAFFTLLIFNHNKIDFETYIENLLIYFKDFSKESIQILFFDFNSKTDFSYFFKSSLINMSIILFDREYNSNIFYIYFKFLNEIIGKYIFFIDAGLEIEYLNINNVLNFIKEENSNIINFKIKNLISEIEIFNYKPLINIKNKEIYFEFLPKENIKDFLVYYNFFLIKKEFLNSWFYSRFLNLSDFKISLLNKIEPYYMDEVYNKEDRKENKNETKIREEDNYFIKFYKNKKNIKQLERFFLNNFSKKNELKNKIDLFLYYYIFNDKSFIEKNSKILDKNLPNFANKICIRKNSFYHYSILYFYFFKIESFNDIFSLVLNYFLRDKFIFFKFKTFVSYFKKLKLDNIEIINIGNFIDKKSNFLKNEFFKIF